jgi:hypothetical protein
MVRSATFWTCCGLLVWALSQAPSAADDPPLNFPDLPQNSVQRSTDTDGAHYSPESTTSSKTSEPAKDPKRDKLASQFEHKLGRFPLSAGKGKRAITDIFVIGIAELNLTSRHADVRFQAKEGQKSVARYLVDYTLDAPDKTLRQWQVLGRVKTDEEADESLKKIRADYDMSVAYRATIAKMYQAASTRRC